MQYAGTKYPKTYRDIISNAGLKKLFVFLESENGRLTLLHDQHRSAILKQFGERMQIRGNFIFNTASHYGKGLYDNEVQDMTALLQKPEHRILNGLRK